MGRRSKQTAEIRRLKSLLPPELIVENDLLRPQVLQLTNSNRDLMKRLEEASTEIKELKREAAADKAVAKDEIQQLKDKLDALKNAK